MDENSAILTYSSWEWAVEDMRYQGGWDYVFYIVGDFVYDFVIL